MGAAWSPYPEALSDHTLRTGFPFSVSRHPMYTVFLLHGTLASWCVTLNWGFAVISLAMIIFMVRRIPVEEAILTELFGEEYTEYSKRVGRLGPRWMDMCGCLDFVYRMLVPKHKAAL